MTGQVTGIVPGSDRVLRVSGRTADADAVTGDATLFNDVITPVSNYIAALNAQIIGTTQVFLNGERGVTGSPRRFSTGVRNAETNLGNLVADSLRRAADSDVAIQNGGGVRASIAGPNISIGDTFNTLTFLNLVVKDETVNATQLKAVLEHGFANSTTSGSAQGRFPQLSGLEVVFDTTRAANDRVRRIVLTLDPSTTADDVVLVDFGSVVDATTTFSVATIDFLANGGDGYPFAANGFSFSNLVVTRNYQEALVDYIELPTVDGGLNGLVGSTQYPVVDAFDDTGRLVDMIYATNGNDAVIGTAGREFIVTGAGNDTVTGSLGRDGITLGPGLDTLDYNSLREAGDVVEDFIVGDDLIDLSDLFTAASTTGVLGGNILFVDVNGGCSVQLVINRRRTPFLILKGVTAAQANNPANFSL